MVGDPGKERVSGAFAAGSLTARLAALTAVIAAGLVSFGAAALALGATKPAEIRMLMKR